MNPTRSTNAPSSLDWLNLIQRGGTEDWKYLYRLCHDLAIAREVAAVLRLRDPDLLASARLWKFLLEDLHPDLQIALNETHRDLGI